MWMQRKNQRFPHTLKLVIRQEIKPTPLAIRFDHHSPQSLGYPREDFVPIPRDETCRNNRIVARYHGLSSRSSSQPPARRVRQRCPRPGPQLPGEVGKSCVRCDHEIEVRHHGSRVANAPGVSVSASPRSTIGKSTAWSSSRPLPT